MNFMQLSSSTAFLPGAGESDRDEEIGERIAEFRRKRRLSLEELAEKLGVSRQAVWYWESGRRLPRATTLAKLKKLGLNMAPVSMGSAEFSDLVQAAKDKLADDLGINPDDIRIVIEG